MFVMNWGCSPHFKQRDEVGFWRSCFSMPHGMSGRPDRQVKNGVIIGAVIGRAAADGPWSRLTSKRLAN
jgi:hypothetical protein